MRTVAGMTLGILAISCATSAGAAEISWQRLTCVPPGGNARVAAEISERFPTASVRVYFRSSVESDEHFIEMRRSSPGSYWAVLPVPSARTSAVAFRVVARGADGEQLATPVTNVPVSSPCPVLLADEELRSARNLVIGLSGKSQPVVPQGFECRGIVARISADGDLAAYPACAEAARASALALTVPTPACPGCGTLTVGGTSGVSVGGGTIGGGPPPEPTPTPGPMTPVRPTPGR